MDIQQIAVNSEVGSLFLVGSEKGLNGVFWSQQKIPLVHQEEAHDVLKMAWIQIDEYLRGVRKTFDLPLAPRGTEFQKRVWMILRDIPYGQTISYSEQAHRLGQPRAVRAVGAANGKNPLSIVVPCHRVVASSGGLTGYAGGLDIKKRLLELEKGL